MAMQGPRPANFDDVQTVGYAATLPFVLILTVYIIDKCTSRNNCLLRHCGTNYGASHLGTVRFETPE